jgi:alpha-L-rhamnosidase
MLTKKGSRSFENMWKNYGATTLWEVLPVDDVLSRKTQNERSHSHPMNAGYDEWFFRGIAGIHPDERFPGFKKIVFRPYFTMKLKNAEASYESPYGTITSRWRWEGKIFKWDIRIPANSSADLYFPKLFDHQQILVNDEDCGADRSNDSSFPGYSVCKSVGSGSYTIEIKKKYP